MRNFKIISGSICAPLGFQCASVFCDIKKLGTGKGSEKGRKDDLALIVSDVPATVAGMFTTNQVCAAPVKITRKAAARRSARAIVVNSGNANACTGARGLDDAKQMARSTASALAMFYSSRRSVAKADERGISSNRATVTDRRYKIKENDILVCSTGRIGVSMPMKNVERGIGQCAPLLTRSASTAKQVAEAIMTTDTARKQIAVELKIGGRTVRIGGICKGAGMIAPGMALAKSVATGLRPVGTWRRIGQKQTAHRAVATNAKHATMLCFITTDAAVEPIALRRALRAAVEQSFNQITVDGDMSTNDSVIMLANGLAGNPVIGGARLSRAGNPVIGGARLSRAGNPVIGGARLSRAGNPVIGGARLSRAGNPDSIVGSRGLSSHRQKFQNALNYVCLELAKMIVRDGEGTSRLVRLVVKGAVNEREAELAARAIANSSLVRASWSGSDPNWGRILCALGYSKARVNESLVDIGYASSADRKILFAFRRGRPTNVALKTLARITSAAEFDLQVDLHLGRGEFTLYAADLTEEYVALNKGDVNDSTTLGG